MTAVCACIRMVFSSVGWENGFVHLPETAPWLAEYLHELAVFPNGKHDDQADSTAQFLDWFRRPCPVSSFIETMRLVERVRKPENPERCGNPWLLCRGTGSSNPSPSSGQSVSHGK